MDGRELRLERRLTAGNRQYLARHVARFLGREEHEQRCDFGRLCPKVQQPFRKGAGLPPLIQTPSGPLAAAAVWKPLEVPILTGLERIVPIDALDELGVVLTMYDKRNQLSRQVVNEVVHNFPGRVFDAVIPRTISVAEAPSFGKTILQFDPGSKAAQAYRQLAQEIIRLS